MVRGSLSQEQVLGHKATATVILTLLTGRMIESLRFSAISLDAVAPRARQLLAAFRDSVGGAILTSRRSSLPRRTKILTRITVLAGAAVGADFRIRDVQRGG
jgi:hypothetical protein